MFSSDTTQVSDGGYQISRSLRFNSADSAYLNRTPASAGNRKTWTWSGWVKRGTLGTLQTVFGINVVQNDSQAQAIFFGSDDKLKVIPWTDNNFVSNAVFRDPSAWYHIVVAFDSTNATANNRVIVYVNNINQSGTYPLAVTLNADYGINQAGSHRLGDWPASGFNTFGGYMTEVNFIDGQALTPSSFGETNAQTGVWQPKAYSGSYGTNGFYLNFSDNSNTTAATLGKDYSGNGNNWTPNNFSVTAGAGNDSLVDSPTSYGTDTGVGGTVRGNYATWNPLWLSGTFVNGNLDATTATGDSAVGTTFGMSSGKWYVELTITRTAPTTGGAAYITVGLIPQNMPAATTNGYTATSYGYYSQNGTKYTNSSGSSYGASYDVNDIIGIAFDADAGTLTFYKNGTSQGTAFTSIPAGTYFFAIGEGSGASTASATLNAGQRPFAYTAPSGYKALCTQNLPTPTIGATTATQAGKYFNTVTYTGNGSSRSITGLGFQPSFTWIKDRSAGFYHRLADAVRGVGKELYSNDTGAETTNSANGYVTSFDSDGFSLGTGIGVNQNATTYVAWNWKANGSGSTNTAGSITSTVSANTTSGFSVVTYTGTGSLATVGHGLGATPKMFIVKRRDTTSNWLVYNSVIGATNYLYLNTTDASAAWSGFWGNTAPTSTVFTVNNDGAVNSSGNTFVAYCFAEVAGYSKFGSYTGNGSTDGPFVFTGFKPAYIMVKCSSSGGTDWIVEDATRSTTNVMDARLFPNTSDAELSNGNGNIDFLSNGFKLRNAHAGMNASGSTYIYACFASVPTKFSLAR